MFSVSGNSGDFWNTQNIDISSYYGEVVKFRFIGLTGNDFSSDIAIDQIGIGDPIIPDYCDSNGNDTSDEYIGRVQLNTLDNNNNQKVSTCITNTNSEQQDNIEQLSDLLVPDLCYKMVLEKITMIIAIEEIK